MEKLLLAIGVFVIALFTGCVKEMTPENVSQELPASSVKQSLTDLRRPYMPHRVLVKFKKSTGTEKRQRALGLVSGKLKEMVYTQMMKETGEEGVYVLDTPLEVKLAIEKMKASPDVEYVEPDYLVTAAATTSDPYYTGGELWGLNSSSYSTKAYSAWKNDHTGSQSVYVGIIDQGVQVNHPDLQSNVWVNPYDKPDGIDNDGNGYIDDVNGWDFWNNDNTVYDGGATGTEDHHGTHVAGTIGARSNGNGVVGMNWKVTMISCKFMGPQGGYVSGAIKALDYLTDLKKRKGLRIVATNNSWGGGGYSQAMYDAIERSNAANILFVVAAGNGGADAIGDDNDLTASYPSGYTNANVIAVAAMTSSGARSSFSNYGKTSVDIAAPGSDILSTIAGGAYGYLSGTSMATPHVTGACALYAASRSSATAATIKSAILSKGTSTTAFSGKTVTGKRLTVSSF
ncbi:S8 family peptidase [Paraflavisolibacter sp. H34]|uniref:S8 family peptidase n=1 Tax=Huijunlia imazamoxiresistens TaxID=3127457 RepID=UPI00301AE3CA